MNTIAPENYFAQLEDKLSKLHNDFADLDLPNIEVFQSKPLNFRMRAEFKVWHEGDISTFAMNVPGKKQIYTITDFPIGSKRINELMPQILEVINQSDTIRRRLFSAEFLTTLQGEAIISLIYHRKLDAVWEDAATKIHQQLGVSIIGRARKQKIVIGCDFVTEHLTVDNETYHYQQIENSFTQPNAEINQKMLSWAKSCANGLGGDLLELYCGNANFTCVLAKKFTRVLATEVSKVSVRSALMNLESNQIHNVTIVRMSSEEFTQALNNERPFRRLKNIPLSDYRFSTIFVDPPRAGLDPDTETLTAGFNNILYVSCNPETLYTNLQTFIKTHEIKRFAVFDQFPYTPHVECGVWLQRL